LDISLSQGSFSATSAEILKKGASGSGFDLSPNGSGHGALGDMVGIPDLVTRRTEHFWAEFKDQQQRDKGAIQ